MEDYVELKSQRWRCSAWLAAESGERIEVGRVGDNAGGARKRPEGERHGVRMLQ